MIAISKAEKDAVRERFPNLHIVRTMVKDSKRHHYYMTESKGAMRLLNSLRRGDAHGT